MKLNHPAKRLTAALLSGAMLLSLSAPALAADPGTAPDSVPFAAAALNEENGSADVSFSINNISYTLDPTQDMDFSNDGAGPAVSYAAAEKTLTFTGAFTGPVTIDAPGVNIVFTGDASQKLISGDLTITHSASVDISNLQDDVTSGARAIAGNADITSDGDVSIRSVGSAIDAHEASITSGGDVTITSSSGNAVSCYGAATISCSRDVFINSNSTSNFAVDANALIIENAQDVTITSQKAIFHGFITSSSDPDPTVSITCSGEVTLESTGSDATLLKGLLYVFNPGPDSQTTTLTYQQAGGSAYEVWADNALLTDAGAAGTPFTFDENTTYSSVRITPDAPPVDLIDPADSTGAAGGAVAAVLVGGAAVFGGYEIATRVILNDLLPEGAAIPANRGQLALLLWNTAGRPAPAGTPAFADVTDPDTAAAAQWCVEQGHLDARKDGKFDPNGWTPKFRVIEVWNRAFPKQ